MPRRISPQTSTGTLCWLPMLNQVTTNSSSDSAAASSAAPTIDGPDQRQGDVAEGAGRRGAEVARRFEDAEVEGLEPGIHGQDDEGEADEDVADGGVDAGPGARPSARKKTASEMPMTSSGTTAGSRLAARSAPPQRGRSGA